MATDPYRQYVEFPIITCNLIEWAQQSGVHFNSHYFNCWFEVFADVRERGVTPLQDGRMTLLASANIINAWVLERQERKLALHGTVRQDPMANPSKTKELYLREMITAHWNKKIIN